MYLCSFFKVAVKILTCTCQNLTVSRCVYSILSKLREFFSYFFATKITIIILNYNYIRCVIAIYDYCVKHSPQYTPVVDSFRK